MKKFLLAMLCGLTVLGLMGCKEQNVTEEATLVAKATDFDTHYYQSDRYMMYLEDEVLTIHGQFVNDERKSVLDNVVVSEDMKSPFIHKEYSNAKVNVKGDTYLITADDGVSLEFTKFMQHIIVDEKGMEYIRKAK